MKKLVMSALAIGALVQATGCIFVSDDTGDDISGDTASIDVTWSLVDDDVAGSCPGSTATIYAQIGSDQPYTDIFDCADGGGVAVDLPLADYVVWVELTDGSGATLLAASESFDVSLTAAGETQSYTAIIDVANGFFDVAWELRTAAGGSATCADFAGEDGVSIISTLAGPNTGFDDQFDCEDGAGTTFALPIGNYTIDADVINAQNQSLGSSPATTSSIEYGNEFVDLGTMVITFGQ